MSLAWHIAAFQRSKKMPKLATILRSAEPPREKRVQSPAEMVDILRQWRAYRRGIAEQDAKEGRKQRRKKKD